MKNLLRTLTVLAALLFCASVSAQQIDPGPGIDPSDITIPQLDVEDFDSTEVDAAIILLSGYHGIPDRTVFEEALENPRDVLLAIAQDDEMFAMHRDRAMAALGYWADDQIYAFYLDRLEADETSEMNRHRLIGLLASSFGDTAIEDIEPFLVSDDVQFRLTAVHALTEIASPAAMSLLDTALSIETNSIVIDQIEVGIDELLVLPQAQ